jgi:hypothetical protein
MATKTTKAQSEGFSAAERAAMKRRAAELRAEGKKGAKKADDLQAVLDAMKERGLRSSRDSHPRVTLGLSRQALRRGRPLGGRV